MALLKAPGQGRGEMEAEMVRVRLGHENGLASRRALIDPATTDSPTERDPLDAAVPCASSPIAPSSKASCATWDSPTGPHAALPRRHPGGDPLRPDPELGTGSLPRGPALPGVRSRRSIPPRRLGLDPISVRASRSDRRRGLSIGGSAVGAHTSWSTSPRVIVEEPVTVGAIQAQRLPHMDRSNGISGVALPGDWVTDSTPTRTGLRR